MRKFLISAMLGVSLMFGGCAGFNPNIRTDVKVEQLTLQKQVQTGIDNANAAITVADQSLVQAVKDGTISYENGKEYHIKLGNAAGYVELAEGLLKNGDITQADTQLKIGQGFLTIVKEYLKSQAVEVK